MDRLVQFRQAKSEDFHDLVDLYNDIIAEGGFSTDLQPYGYEEKQDWFNQCNQHPYQIQLVPPLVVG